jgi:hypothetical protein
VDLFVVVPSPRAPKRPSGPLFAPHNHKEPVFANWSIIAVSVTNADSKSPSGDKN